MKSEENKPDQSVFWRAVFSDVAEPINWDAARKILNEKYPEWRDKLFEVNDFLGVRPNMLDHAQDQLKRIKMMNKIQMEAVGVTEEDVQRLKAAIDKRIAREDVA